MKSYQTLKQQLDEIIAELQAEDLDVDKAVELYQQGQKIVAELEIYLTKTKQSLVAGKSPSGKKPKAA